MIADWTPQLRPHRLTLDQGWGSVPILLILATTPIDLWTGIARRPSPMPRDGVLRSELRYITISPFRTVSWAPFAMRPSSKCRYLACYQGALGRYTLAIAYDASHAGSRPSAPEAIPSSNPLRLHPSLEPELAAANSGQTAITSACATLRAYVDNRDGSGPPSTVDTAVRRADRGRVGPLCRRNQSQRASTLTADRLHWPVPKSGSEAID